MIILDENFVESQRQLLQSWRFSFKQIGLDIGREGMKDDEIIPLLQQLKHPTFFTMDADFFKPRLCHARYGIVFLDVAQYESAIFVRRVLRHKEMSTKANRMGTVMRISHVGLFVWQLNSSTKTQLTWV